MLYPTKSQAVNHQRKHCFHRRGNRAGRPVDGTDAHRIRRFDNPYQGFRDQHDHQHSDSQARQRGENRFADQVPDLFPVAETVDPHDDQFVPAAAHKDIHQIQQDEKDMITESVIIT